MIEENLSHERFIVSFYACESHQCTMQARFDAIQRLFQHHTSCLQTRNGQLAEPHGYLTAPSTPFLEGHFEFRIAIHEKGRHFNPKWRPFIECVFLAFLFARDSQEERRPHSNQSQRRRFWSGHHVVANIRRRIN